MRELPEEFKGLKFDVPKEGWDLGQILTTHLKGEKLNFMVVKIDDSHVQVQKLTEVPNGYPV